MLYRFKYPKLTLLILAIALAYLLFRNPDVSGFVSNLGDLRYLGIFIAGLLFPFGFTAPFSVGFFLVLEPENIILSGIIAGLGAMISNLLIFTLIRFSFKDEIISLEKSLEKMKPVKAAESIMNHTLSRKIKHYLTYIFIGIIIVSPIPDEFGDIILAGMKKVKIWFIALLSFILSTIGIVILLSI